MQQPSSTFQRLKWDTSRGQADKEEEWAAEDAASNIKNGNKTNLQLSIETNGTHRESSIFHNNVLIIMFPALAPILSWFYSRFFSLLFVPISSHALFYSSQFFAQCTQVVIFCLLQFTLLLSQSNVLYIRMYRTAFMYMRLPVWKIEKLDSFSFFVLAFHNFLLQFQQAVLNL